MRVSMTERKKKITGDSKHRSRSTVLWCFDAGLSDFQDTEGKMEIIGRGKDDNFYQKLYKKKHLIS